jgi:type II secretory pathway pseudopilin PulG
MSTNPYESPETPSEAKPPGRLGFRLIELLVVVGLIGLLIAMLLPAVRTSGEAGRRFSCSNNLKQIALALHNYHDEFGSFPPVYTVDDAGTRLHSWRTLILPYMGCNHAGSWCFSRFCGVERGLGVGLRVSGGV